VHRRTSVATGAAVAIAIGAENGRRRMPNGNTEKKKYLAEHCSAKGRVEK